jgi:hypothetical protein
MKITFNKMAPATFGGGQLNLQPGVNDVDDAIFDDFWAKNAVLRGMFAEGNFVVERDGKSWSPDVEMKPAEHPPVRMVEIPSAILGAEKPQEEPDPARLELIEPTQLGSGAVPGDARSAKAAVANANDRVVLEAWLANDERPSVRRAIRARLDELAA